MALIDEYAQLLSLMKSKQERDAFERDLMSLAAVARATGIHLVLATQRPSSDVVTSVIRANLPAAVALSVATHQNSQIIIGRPGAEHLLGKGDMLFNRGNGIPVRLQAPYMSDSELDEFLSMISASGYYSK